MRIFKGDDTGGTLGKRLVIKIHSKYDLTGCLVIFTYQGVTRKWENVHDGDNLEIFFSHNETMKMSVGTFKGVLFTIDSAGKYRTINHAVPIEVTTDLKACYGADELDATVGQSIDWENVINKPFEGMVVDLSTDDKQLAALGTIIEKLGGTVKASIALLALCAATAFGYTPESHTNSFERDGVTYAQRGGLGASAYVVTNIDASAVGKVQSVNGKTGDVSLDASDVGALPLVEDANGQKTAVTIGRRRGDVGPNSLANGNNVTASGVYSHAEGGNTTASGYLSHAAGYMAQTRNVDEYSFAWNGDRFRSDMYSSHGPGTFNINPYGGLDGFYIGEQTLYTILTNKADKADISATDPTFSNAVLAVGLNIDTNSVAVLNEIAATFGGFPIEGTATTVGGLLAALAAAVAWLKKNKRGLTDFDEIYTTFPSGDVKPEDFPNITWSLSDQDILEWDEVGEYWHSEQNVFVIQYRGSGRFVFASSSGSAEWGGYPPDGSMTVETDGGATFTIRASIPGTRKISRTANLTAGGLAKFGADGVLEKATEGVDYLKTHQDISGKQDKIMETGVLKGGGAGAILPAIPSSSDGELADYRDPKDAKCYESVDSWTWEFPDGLTHELPDPVWNDESPVSHWTVGPDVPESPEAYDENATSLRFIAGQTWPKDYSATATRHLIATKDKPFVTADNAARTLECGEGDAKQTVTVENGVAKLDGFFGESNSLLNGRLSYSRNATGLKDRAFNTLSFDGTEFNLSTALAAVTPTASGQPRDLLIVATATAATTISFTAGTIKGDKPTIDGSGTWLITLTEYASGVWYCRQIKMEDAA